MLEVRLLSQFSVERDGERLELPSRPAQSLLAYLILNPDVQHRRERLAGMLWPDSTEASAKNNLRQALWRIKRSIEDDDHKYILADRFTVSFDAASDHWLDVNDLVSDPNTVEQRVRVLSAYEGELLPGFYDEWVVPEREHIQIVFEHQGDELLKHLEQKNRWGDLVEWGENLIARASTLEPAYRAVMRGHYELGDGARAVAAYERCVEALKEFGVEPSIESKQLLEEITRGERQPAALTVRGAHDPLDFLVERLETQHTTFVGRRRELGELGKHLQDSVAGSGWVVFISGEAGSGKTALMREFARHAHAEFDGLLVARGDCNAVTGPGDPYLPFREALECLVGDLESLWSRRALSSDEARRAWGFLPLSVPALLDQGPDLVGSFVSLAWLDSVSDLHGSIDPEMSRRVHQIAAFEGATSDRYQAGIFDDYVQFLSSLSASQPLLVTLDDFQWADTGSVDLLFHLARRIEHENTLVLCSYRPDEVALGRDGMPHPLRKVMLELETCPWTSELALSAGTDRSFVDELIDSEPNRLHSEFRNSLYEQTRGHPLFTVELLRDLQARGILVQDDEVGWSRAATLDWESLPPRVEGVIEERIARLDPRLQEILNIASVEGETFTAEAIARVIGRDERALVRLLGQELDKRHQLTAAQGTRRIDGQRQSVYTFRHRLFQRHLYRRLDPVERAYLHEEIGKIIEQTYTGRTEEVAVQLARHFEQAGDAARAIRYLQQAGEQARRLSANSEAVAHLKKAIGLLGSVPAGELHEEYELGLQISLGGSLIVTKGYGAPEVEAAFERARILSQKISTAPQLFPALWGLWSFQIVRASHQAAFELGTQLRRIAGRDRGLLLEANRALGSSLLYMGGIRRARSHLEKGLALYDPRYHSGHGHRYGSNPLVACLSNLALLLWFLGYSGESSSRMEQALSYAETVDHPHSLGYALVIAASLHSSRREWQKTLEYSDKAIFVSKRHGFPLWLAAATILRGAALHHLGDKGGSRVLSEGLEAWRATGAVLGLPHYLGLLAETQPQDQQALATLRQALELSTDRGERLFEPALLWRMGERQRAISTERAEGTFGQAIQSARAMRSKSMELRARLSLFQLQTPSERGVTALRRAVAKFGKDDSFPDLDEARSLLA